MIETNSLSSTRRRSFLTWRAHVQSECKAGLTGGSKAHANFFSQCATLTKRSFVNMTRDPGYYWLRVAMYIMVGVCLGTIFLRVGRKYDSILVSHMQTRRWFLHESGSNFCEIDIDAFHSTLVRRQLSQCWCSHQLSSTNYCRRGQVVCSSLQHFWRSWPSVDSRPLWKTWRWVPASWDVLKLYSVSSLMQIRYPKTLYTHTYSPKT